MANKLTGKPVGRPPLYDNAEDMQVIIDEYFEVEEIYTMAGLAYALGMCRKSLINYKNKDEFLHTIKKARNKVEVFVEKSLYGNNVAGPIFNLKNNFGWKDKTEVAQQIEITETREEVKRKIKLYEAKREQELND